ncbi:MAG: hypothetical protein K5987_03370 [Lachnospiraceae bacterium]|nr:hypothetical protein [Lachnospiraceae bacterium]
MELIKCPFCFKKFGRDFPAFKATKAYTLQDVEGMSDEEMRAAEPYAEKPDKEYDEFWNNFPGSKPNFPEEKHAVIYTLPGLGLVGTPRKDADGFVNEVEYADNKKRSDIRICPNCHNPLPHEFGKYPVKYIAIVGITSSGKTVYLSTLLHKISRYLAKANLTSVGMKEQVGSFLEEHPIRRGQELPRGNAVEHLTMPIPITVQSKDTGQRYTVIFYDVAGENCVRPSQMKKFGPFICNADGIIMIVDPKQFDELFEIDSSMDAASPELVVNAMYEAFVSAGGSSNVPLAVALSKSDLLGGHVGGNSFIFRNTDYSEYENMGFAENDYDGVNYEIKKVLGTRADSQGAIFKDALEATFKNYGFFAFSALGCEPQKDRETGLYVLKQEPEPVRIEDPLIWIFYKLGIVNKADRKVKEAGPGPKKGLFSR